MTAELKNVIEIGLVWGRCLSGFLFNPLLIVFQI